MKENIKKSKLITIEDTNHFCYLGKKDFVNNTILNYIKKD